MEIEVDRTEVPRGVRVWQNSERGTVASVGCRGLDEEGRKLSKVLFTMRKLGGATLVWQGNDQDYNYKETIMCLIELCDEISVVAGGLDSTDHDVSDLVYDMGLLFPKLMLHLEIV